MAWNHQGDDIPGARLITFVAIEGAVLTNVETEGFLTPASKKPFP